jgi:acyl carrier protein
VTRDQVIERLRDWLLRHKSSVDASAIGEDTDIIETRILESLQLVEFILFLEQESGREILREELDQRRLRTLAIIYKEFFLG